MSEPSDTELAAKWAVDQYRDKPGLINGPCICGGVHFFIRRVGIGVFAQCTRCLRKWDFDDILTGAAL